MAKSYLKHWHVWYMDEKRFPDIESVEDQKANLTYADLTRANLFETILDDADLTGQDIDDLKSRGAII